MKSPENGEAGGIGQHLPATRVSPLDEESIAASIGEAGTADPRRLDAQFDTRKQRKQTLAKRLFSDDPRQQYAALRQLEKEPEMSDAQQDRVREIQDQTSHLVIAELAQRLLVEKRSARPFAVSDRTRREVATLWKAQEERDRRRRQQAAREAVLVQLPRSTAGRWLACAAIAGGLLGSAATFFVAPRQQERQAAPAEVFIQPRSGELICVEQDSAQGSPPADDRAGFEPAFYCWKCRQWLPLRSPHQPRHAIEGPRQALSARPLATEQAKEQKMKDEGRRTKVK